MSNPWPGRSVGGKGEEVTIAGEYAVTFGAIRLISRVRAGDLLWPRPIRARGEIGEIGERRGRVRWGRRGTKRPGDGGGVGASVSGW